MKKIDFQDLRNDLEEKIDKLEEQQKAILRRYDRAKQYERAYNKTWHVHYQDIDVAPDGKLARLLPLRNVIRYFYTNTSVVTGCPFPSIKRYLESILLAEAEMDRWFQ